MDRLPGYRFLNEHHDQLNAARLGLAAVTTVVGQWVQYAQLICPAGLAFGLGYDDLKSLEAAVGRIHIDLQTVAPAAIDGTHRIQILDPQGTPQGVFYQQRSESLRISAGALAGRLPFPEIPEAWIAQAYSFSFEILGDAAQLINIAASSAWVSMTQARVQRTA
jgi:hypothetical protein